MPVHFILIYLTTLIICTFVQSTSFANEFSTYALQKKSESLILNIEKPDDYRIYKIPDHAYDKRRDANGDRLSAERIYWNKYELKTSSNYSKECVSFSTAQKISIKLSTTESKVTSTSEIKKINCLFQNWQHKTEILKLLREKTTQENYSQVFWQQFIHFRDLFLTDMLGPKAALYSDAQNIFFELSELSKKPSAADLYSEENANQLTYINKDFYTKSVLSKALMVTHATFEYDFNAISKNEIDRYIEEAKIEGTPVVYLMQNDHNEHLWFTEDRSPTHALYSKWGEHNYTVKDEVTVIGGQWDNCLRVSIVDLITRHHAHFDKSPLTINLPLSAIYTEDNKLLKQTLDLNDIEKLVKQIKRGSIFDGYEIEIDDPHDGLITIENDMNKYTGVPDINNFSLRIILNNKEVLYSESDEKNELKVITFNLISTDNF